MGLYEKCLQFGRQWKCEVCQGWALSLQCHIKTVVTTWHDIHLWSCYLSGSLWDAPTVWMPVRVWALSLRYHFKTMWVCGVPRVGLLVTVPYQNCSLHPGWYDPTSMTPQWPMGLFETCLQYLPQNSWPCLADAKWCSGFILSCIAFYCLVKKKTHHAHF